MLRIIKYSLSAFVVLCLVGIGVSVARPQWLPPSLRINQEKLPTWARFAKPEAKDEDAGVYCKEHGVPEIFCTLCHEELSEKLLLCKEHGNIPEDICTLCHPEVAKKNNIVMCEKHGLPKHFCFECGTGPKEQPDDGWCAAHGKPEANCEECAKAKAEGRPLPTKKDGAGNACRDTLPVVKLASAKLAKKIGIETTVVGEEDHAHKLMATAETAYDANHYADISPRVIGFIREVKVDLGQSVRKGDILAIIDSTEVSAAKTQYISSQASLKLAQATVDRVQPLARTGSIAGKAELEVMTALNQAQAAVMDAEQKLRNLGFGDDQVASILKTKDTANLLYVVAPIDGVLVARHAVLGEAVQATTQLFAIADTTRMWLWIDVYENDINKVKPGQNVTFSTMTNGTDPASTATGRITWVGSEVSEQTRTTRVRAEFANPNHHFRSNQFGQASVQIADTHKAVIVPKEAVQRKDKVDVVFIPEGESAYRPQRITTKPTDNNAMLEVTWGLKPGQTVVSKGAFLLKTEIMKGAIGAGCCE